MPPFIAVKAGDADALAGAAGRRFRRPLPDTAADAPLHFQRRD